MCETEKVRFSFRLANKSHKGNMTFSLELPKREVGLFNLKRREYVFLPHG